MDHNPQQQPLDSLKQSQSMERFKATVLELANSNPNNPLTPSQIALIENGLQAFSNFNAPTHPPYSAMIEEAIKKLDSDGSLTTEDLISEYIIKTHEGLPWAHNRYLKHHLSQLCESGELECDVDGSYFLPGQKNPRSSRRQVLQRKLIGRKKDDMFEDGNLGREEVNELSDSQVGCQEEASQGLGMGKKKRRRSYIFVEEEEVVETRVAVREGNMDSGSEMVAIETQNEVLLLKGGEGECNSNLVRDHHQDFSGGLMLVPVIESDATGSAIEKSALEERTADPSARDLMIVPYVDNQLNLAIRKEMIPLSKSIDPIIVCGLPLISEGLAKPKKKVQVYQQRQRSKAPRDKTKALKEEPMLASLDSTAQTSVETKVKQKSQSPKSKGASLLEDSSFKQLQRWRSSLSSHPSIHGSISIVRDSTLIKLKRKSLSPKSKEDTFLEGDGFFKQLQSRRELHTINLENISIEDEEPLCQVMEKLKVASPLASTTVGAQIPKEPPGLENFAEMTPRADKESALIKRTQKHLNLELGSQDKSQHDAEHQREDNVGPSQKKLMDHVPEVPVEAFVNEKMLVVDQIPWKQNEVDQESPVKLIDSTPENEKEKQLRWQLRSQDKSQLVVEYQKEDSDGDQQEDTRCALKLPVAAFVNKNMLAVDQLPQTSNKVDQESSLKLIEVTQENEKGKQLDRQLRSQDKSQHEAELQSEDTDGKSQQEVRHHVVELPAMSFLNEKIPVVDQLPQKPNNADQESSLMLIEATTKNEKEKQLYRQLRSQNKSQHEVERQREANALKSQEEIRLDAIEQLGVAPVNGKLLVFDQLPQKQNKVDQEPPLKLTEATLENKAYVSDVHNQVPDHHPHQLQLEYCPPKKRGRGRPPKSKKATKTKQMLSLEHVSNSSNLQLQNSQKKKKSVKQDGQVRTRKQRASKKDEADPLEPNLKEQEQLSRTECSRNKSSKKRRRGKGGHSGEVKETIAPPMDLYFLHTKEVQGNLDLPNTHLNTDETIVLNLPQQQGQSEPTTSPLGRPRKINNEVIELGVQLKLDDQQEVRLSDQVNNQESQIKKSKRGRPKIQKDGDKDDDHDFGTLEKGATKSGVDPSNVQCLKQGGLKSASHAILEASSRPSQMDLTESPLETSDINLPNFELSEITTSGASSQRDNDRSQPIRRITRSSEAAKFLLESQNGKQHDAEFSGQRRLAKLTPVLVPLNHHCPNKESEDSENEYQVRSQGHKDQEQVKSYEHDHAREKMEVQARESSPITSGHISPPDLGLSAMATSEACMCLDDKSSQRYKDQNQPRRMSTRSSEAAKTFLESQNGKQHGLQLSGQRRPVKLTLAVLPSDHHCPDKSEDSDIEDHGKPVELEQPDESRHCDQTLEKMEGEVNLPKEMSARNVSIQVPLSSKDHLRSRMKRQSQGS